MFQGVFVSDPAFGPSDDPIRYGIRKFDHTDFKLLKPSKDRKQHNIMMLVGNGFDIAALSLLDAKYRTDYQSFFFYLKSMNFNPNNMIFKKMDELRHEHEQKLKIGEAGSPNWSDFEARLQEFVSGSEFMNFKNLRQDLAEIQRHFASFLDLVVSPEVLNELDRKAQHHLWAYCTFGRFLADIDDTAYRFMSFPSQSGHYHLFNFNIINFNYTFLLDNYLYLDQEQFNPHPNNTVDTNFQFRRNPRDYSYPHEYSGRANAATGCSAYLMTEIHHPHGVQSIPRSLLFGIDGTDQEASRGSTHKFEKTFWAQTPRRYRKMIEETELFIIFGSSTGETDRWWWRHILHQVHEGAELIIYKYYPANTPIARQETTSSIESQFINDNYDSSLFGGLELDQAIFDDISFRVHAVKYTDSQTLSAFGFNPSVYDPQSRDPDIILPVR